jgi:hypothetical protein
LPHISATVASRLPKIATCDPIGQRIPSIEPECCLLVVTRNKARKGTVPESLISVPTAASWPPGQRVDGLTGC